MPQTLLSPRLKLICCTKQVLELILHGNDALAGGLGIRVPERWSEFGMDVISYVLARLIEAPVTEGWWTYLPVHRHDNLLIGSCGYKGEPDADGVVEIGYEVIPSYRGQGYATEIASTLIRNAFDDPRVRVVRAHTLSEENASSSVLRKCGMTLVESLEDPEDGQVFRWEVGP